VASGAAGAVGSAEDFVSDGTAQRREGARLLQATKGTHLPRDNLEVAAADLQLCQGAIDVRLRGGQVLGDLVYGQHG